MPPGADIFPREIDCAIRVDTDEIEARIGLPIVVSAFGTTFAVPAGTVTDFASVPRLLWEDLRQYVTAIIASATTLVLCISFILLRVQK